MHRTDRSWRWESPGRPHTAQADNADAKHGQSPLAVRMRNECPRTWIPGVAFTATREFNQPQNISPAIAATLTVVVGSARFSRINRVRVPVEPSPGRVGVVEPDHGRAARAELEQPQPPLRGCPARHERGGELADGRWPDADCGCPDRRQDPRLPLASGARPRRFAPVPLANP